MVRLQWLMLFLLASPAWCVSPLTITTSPGDATVFDMDSGNMVAQGTSDGTITWTPTAHQYRIHRPPYDDEVIDVAWSNTLGRWQITSQGHPSPPLLAFSRTATLQFSPPDAVLYQEAESGDELTMDGRTFHALPVPHDGSIYTIPAASVLYLARPGFVTQAIDDPFKSWSLRPRWGPFSYWQFNLALALAGAGIGCGWWFVLRPRARRHWLNRQRAEALQKMVEPAHLAGQTVAASQLGRFVLLRLLGTGAMGSVYEAGPMDVDRQERVAIKLMLGTGKYGGVRSMERFRNEVRICATLSHPSIVQIMDWGTVTAQLSRGSFECPFIVMELVAGRTLASCLQGEPVSEATTLQWVEELLRALKAAHQAGIVHRDVKPDNVMILPNGRLKLMDFGIARILEGTVPAGGPASGTPKYMSPEQFGQEPVGPASDLFSLGVIAYEALSGHVPFADEAYWALMVKVMHEAPPPLANVSPPVMRLVMKLMAKKLEDRYRTAEDALADLEHLEVKR